MSEEYEDEIARAIADLAYQVKYLGNGNAATQMGAIEALGVVFKEGFESLSSSIRDVAEALREVADNMRERKS